MTSKKEGYTTAELAALTGARLEGESSTLITGVAELAQATPCEASFYANPRYVGALLRTHAGVVCVKEGGGCPENLTLLIHEEPSLVFQKIAELLTAHRPPLTGFMGIHPTAVIHPTALVGEGVKIGPYAVIDSGVIIGKGSSIGAHSYIGPETVLGQRCLIHPHVVIREGCRLGNGVIVQPGAVLGACGFGYITTAAGTHTKLEQVGSVVVGDDVEVGANSAIDRGRFPSQSTAIGHGTKIDNLVQVAHGVSIGAHAIICGQVGIAGSTKLGDHCTIGGQAAIAGHITLDAGVMVAGRSAVSKSLKKGVYRGNPALPIAEYNKIAICLRRLPKIFVEEGLAKFKG